MKKYLSIKFLGCEKVEKSSDQPGTCSAPASSCPARPVPAASAKVCPERGPAGRRRACPEVGARVWARQDQIRITRRRRRSAPPAKSRSWIRRSASRTIYFMGGFSCWRSCIRVRVRLHMRFGSSDFAEWCNFNRNAPIFSNRHRCRQWQPAMFSRLCKHHLRTIICKHRPPILGSRAYQISAPYN
jgi:hypothetical protein